MNIKHMEDNIMFNDGNSTFTMPVAPAYGGYGNNDGFFGGDFGGFILGLLFGGLGGWGGFGGFGGLGGFGGAMMGADMFGLYPWLNNSQNINDGFRDQMLNSTVQGIQNSVTSGFGDVQLGIADINQNICQTGNATVSAITNAQNSLAQQMYTNQISDLERSFAAQTANTQAINGVNMSLQNCCCENRSSINDVKYTLATEACATRATDTQNTQNILNVINGGIQSIKDQLCQDKIDAKNDTISQLRSELLYARGQASQDVQTAVIQAGQRSLANEVEQYVAPRPIPSYIVQNPNCCGGYSTCGCNNF